MAVARFYFDIEVTKEFIDSDGSKLDDPLVQGVAMADLLDRSGFPVKNWGFTNVPEGGE